MLLRFDHAKKNKNKNGLLVLAFVSKSIVVLVNV